MAKGRSKQNPPDSSTPRRPDRDRRVRQNLRIAQALNVLYLIQSRGRWNAKSIAGELECSERTVYRMLEVLEFAGVPWSFDREKQCYVVRSDFKFPTLTLTEDEAIGQAIATSLSSIPDLTPNSGAKPTTRKLAAQAPERIQQVICDANRLIEVFDLKLSDHSSCQNIVKCVQQSLFTGKQVTGTYQSPYELKSRKLTIHPYRLCLIKQAWYLIGRIQGENEVKTLRVHRFKSLRTVDKEADVPAEFDLKQYFGNAWSVYRGASTYSVVLRFSSQAAKLVTETRWHHTQKVTKRSGGHVDVSFQVDGLEEIVHWILGWSGSVKVLAPDELKVLVVEHLENAIQINSESTKD